MRLIAPTNEANRNIIAKKRLCPHGHSRPAIKKPYPTKRVYLFSTTRKTNQQKNTCCTIFCSLPLKGRQYVEYIYLRSPSFASIRIVASFGLSRCSSAFARDALPTTVTPVAVLDSKLSESPYKWSISLPDHHLAGQRWSEHIRKNYLPNLKSKPIPQAIEVRL